MRRTARGLRRYCEVDAAGRCPAISGPEPRMPFPRTTGTGILPGRAALRPAEVARYTRIRQQLTGQQLPADTIELGYRWAALQIPVQYLPWTTGQLPTREPRADLVGLAADAGVPPQQVRRRQQPVQPVRHSIVGMLRAARLPDRATRQHVRDSTAMT
jgi:hypothetical protein